MQDSIDCVGLNLLFIFHARSSLYLWEFHGSEESGQICTRAVYILVLGGLYARRLSVDRSNQRELVWIVYDLLSGRRDPLIM